MNDKTFQKACDIKAEIQGIIQEIETLENIIDTNEAVSITVTLGDFCSKTEDFYLNEFDLLEPHLKNYLKALREKHVKLKEKFDLL